MHPSSVTRLQRLLAAAGPQSLQGGLKGLEKETLRVTPRSHIARTPHPPALGAALTHPSITTDYSEALLEFVTAPAPALETCLDELDAIHRYTLRHLPDAEVLWANSMPCVLDGEASIPIGWYGRSNPGFMKHVYRRGLGYRYGKLMQVIAGVHFNFSLPEPLWPLLRELEGSTLAPRDYASAGYFRLIRNLQRVGWLVPYLFGASPAVCNSFLAGKPAPLERYDADTAYRPFATSLRMSGIGYQNRKSKRCGTHVSYSSLDTYVSSLERAVTTPCPEYQAIGIQVAGDWRQLNANILQIENEYYSTMRPKQPPRGNEKPVHALRDRGVAYVELRSLDLDPFEPIGVSAPALRFLEALLLGCALADSPLLDADEDYANNGNLERVALGGRDPALELVRAGRPVALAAWAGEILDTLAPLCEALDAGRGDAPYAAALAEMRARVADPARTPSARVLAWMREHATGFVGFVRHCSDAHAAALRARPLPGAQEAAYAELARRSLAEQAALEAADTLPFDEYLRRYFADAL